MSEVKNAAIGGWDEDYKDPNKEQDKDSREYEWLSFSAPGDYKVRLVGKYVRFYRHWEPFITRVITHPSYKEEDPAWQAGFYPRKTYAIHVIDRSDGKLKILEKGPSIFDEFIRYKVVNEVSPSDAVNGPNFVISVEWPKGNKLQAKYKVTAQNKPAPFTDEEKTMITANIVKLDEIYKSTPLEKIKELWDAIPDEKKIKENSSKETKETEKASSPNSSEKATPPAENMTDAPADTDDLFGGDNDDASTDW